ncbi:RAB6A-GEF complex partner protein 2 [Eupeodes corollae]|uniref:RAB6A-GEF complex partner protein 2 n=1 Tax=Eupeodes corollae TaxID=290404 RepID=UPI0024939728|nr:RAB6A-GEF complex partner protein 2 [Eupeodes corollae]
MIEITAKLIRADSAIYAAGEKVECLIEFTNRNEENANQTFNDHSENLAWASVQIHCYRKTTFCANSVSDLTEMIGKTALDAVTQTPGEIIVATKPKILFCDLKLRPAETKIYFFNDFVPREGPPTYRGHDIKYFYKITIATQRVKSKVQTLTVPIRVLPIPVIPRPEELGTETNEELTPTNPFLEKREITELEVSWHHLKNVTARRSPKFFRITNKRGYVGRFCLFKTAYKLGEDIVGSLDFANFEVRCVQFSVKLQSEEILLRKTIPTKDESDTASVNSLSDHSNSIASVEGLKSTINDEVSGKFTTYATSHQVCYSMLQTQIIIPIPLHAAPSFRTDLVDVRWRLHFEFVSSTMMDIGKPNVENGELTAPQEIPVETMIWNLPVTIYSANPLQIYSPSPAYNLLIR